MITVKSTTKGVKPAKNPIVSGYAHQVGLSTERSIQRMVGGALPVVAKHTGEGNLIGVGAPRLNKNHNPEYKHSQRLDRAPNINPFIKAVDMAFCDHYPLTIRPDDVWLCIAQGFAAHVTANAEELRPRFVKHEGKVTLQVTRLGWVWNDTSNDWEGVFPEFSDLIADHIGKTRDLIVSDFSTTGVIERAASEIVLMDAMSKYFTYEMLTCCGIPYINLMGDVKDWESVRQRAAVLGEYGLEWWTKPLDTVLERIVQAAKGKNDSAFWEDIYHLGGGSGGPFVNGWINAFFPYLAGGYKNHAISGRGEGPGPGRFPIGISRVEMLMESNPTMELMSGFAGTVQNEALEIQPSIGWAVREKDGPEIEEEPGPEPEVAKGSPRGTVYMTTEPATYSTPLMVLPADVPSSNKPIGFVVKQSKSIGIVNKK